MAEIVVNHFELDRIPQPLPRAGKDTINELVLQLRERRLDSLAYLRKQELMMRRILAGQQQHRGFFCQQCRCWLTTVAKITKRNAAIGIQHQAQCRILMLPGISSPQL